MIASDQLMAFCIYMYAFKITWRTIPARPLDVPMYGWLLISVPVKAVACMYRLMNNPLIIV